MLRTPGGDRLRFLIERSRINHVTPSTSTVPHRRRPAGRPAVRRQTRSDRTRRRIVDAALVEFADHGFDGATTRAIAERADVAQPLVHYHFGSKDDLWRAAVDRCFEELDHHLAPVAATTEPLEALRTMLRCFVTFAAATPQLNRIVAQEGSTASDRLTWLVGTHTEPRYRAFAQLLAAVDPEDVVTTDPSVAFHTVVGAASLRYVASAEVVRMTGTPADDPDAVRAHAELIERMVLRHPDPNRPAPPARSTRRTRP